MTNNEELRLKALICKQADIIERQTEMKNNFKKVAIQAVATAEDIAAERDKLLQENIELHTDVEELQNRLDFLRKYFATIKYQLTWLCGNPNPIIAERATRQLEDFEKYIKTYGE